MAKKPKTTERQEVMEAIEEEVPEAEAPVAVEPETPASEQPDETQPETPVESKSPKSAKKGAKAQAGSKDKAAKPGATGKKGDGGDAVPPKPGESAELSPQQRRRRLVTVIAIGAGALAIVSVLGYLLVGQPSEPTASAEPTPPGSASTVQLIPRRIDGVLDDPEDQNRHPVAIMVENHTQARPQSGLDKANIVYEALAEGGITRFMAIYTLTDPIAEIGPVRSARPYYVDWARGYGAMYAHIGGSQKALGRISSTQTFDLNQFFNSQYFYRDRSRDVASEHTLYTSSKLMALALIDKQAPAEGSFQPWKYGTESAPTDRPASQHLTITYSTFSYKVDYEYDPVQNVYARLQADQPHTVKGDIQIKPKNVVVITVKKRLEEPVDGKGRLEMDTIGEGPARFFRDGKEVIGTWKKAAAQDALELLNADGTPFLLNPGQTWVEVVSPDQAVSVR